MERIIIVIIRLTIKSFSKKSKCDAKKDDEEEYVLSVILYEVGKRFKLCFGRVVLFSDGNELGSNVGASS